jgi:hypothetical protein
LSSCPPFHMLSQRIYRAFVSFWHRFPQHTAPIPLSQRLIASLQFRHYHIAFTPYSITFASYLIVSTSLYHRFASLLSSLRYRFAVVTFLHHFCIALHRLRTHIHFAFASLSHHISSFPYFFLIVFNFASLSSSLRYRFAVVTFLHRFRFTSPSHRFNSASLRCFRSTVASLSRSFRVLCIAVAFAPLQFIFRGVSAELSHRFCIAFKCCCIALAFASLQFCFRSVPAVLSHRFSRAFKCCCIAVAFAPLQFCFFAVFSQYSRIAFA